nr:GFA family protein [uncultured Agrobacterium sp.]
MTIHTGGCQCGAIRFRVEGDLKDSSICHCRMCQKAFGAYYAPLVSVRGATFEWTRGEPKRFRSSNHVKRGFCGDCGTPLTYEAPDGMAIASGAFDDPSVLPPVIQWGIENKIVFVDHLHSLPKEETEADQTSASYIADLVSYQHLDHDTSEWPQERHR